MALLGMVIGIGGGLFKARTEDGRFLGLYSSVGEAAKAVGSTAGSGRVVRVTAESASAGEANDDAQESYRIDS